MSPLQMSVYWRLSLVFFFTSFLFFLDIFTAAIVAATCHLGNNTGVSVRRGALEGNQSLPGQDEADWMTESGIGDVREASGTAGVCVLARHVRPRARHPSSAAPLPRHSLPDGRLLLLHQHLLLQSGGGVDPACLSPLASGLPAVLLQSRDNGRSSAGLAQLHLETAAPVAGSASAHLSAALPVGAHTCLPVSCECFNELTLVLCLSRSIPESPRWLLLKRRTDALDSYRSNSPADKHCLDLLLDSAWSDLQKATEAQEEPPPGGHAPSDIMHLRHPTVLLRLFIMSYLSAASALTYFGICMNIGSFGVGVYSAQFFSGLSEAPCLLIPLVRLGRRPLSMLALFLSGAACFLSLLLSRYNAKPELVMSLALLGKLCILAATFISILYSIELFPTVVRQRCVSLVNLCFRLGCLVNSLVPPNSNGAISLAAMVVYSSGPIVGCSLCLLLPETSGVPLPDSVEDCDRQPRPRPPSMSALWRTRKLVSSQTRKTEIPPAEKDDTHSGLIGAV